MSAPFLDEIVQSLDLNPEQWTYYRGPCTLDLPECPCQWLETAYHTVRTLAEESSRRQVHPVTGSRGPWFHRRPEVTILHHVNGTLLLDDTPGKPWSGWKVLEPRFMKLGWWATRKLGAAVRRYCAWRLRESLIVLE